MYWLVLPFRKRGIILRLDHQPLFGKGARAPPSPKGRDANQTREERRKSSLDNSTIAK